MSGVRAESTKRSWLDPDIRKSRSEGIASAQAERLDEMSLITINLWKNDDYRQKQHATRARNRKLAREGWPRVNCLQCNAEFTVRPCRFGVTKFCDRTCQTVYRTGRPNLKNKGRTPSRRAGSGISGSYKGQLFRSLYELSFIINVLEANNIIAEYETLHIPLIDGSSYIPDFISHQTKTIYEIKYVKALSQPRVAMKLEAGRKYAEEMGYVFEVYTEQQMRVFSLNEIVELVKANVVTLHSKRNGGVVYRRLMKELEHE